MSIKIKKAIDILVHHNSPDLTIFRNRTNFTKLMDILDHPYRSFKAIHITGTNGKGSVALKTAQILKHHFAKKSKDAKIGLYTSPHLFTFRERIQVNGQYANLQSICDKIIQIEQICVKQKLPISYFQYLTAAAFMYYKQYKCEYVSLEVGLGGKKDTTNIVTPEVSVITSIGFDHVDILGPTLQDIARQKSGIIKPGKPVVLGPSAIMNSILKVAQDNKCKVYKVQQPRQKFINFDHQNNVVTQKITQVLNQQYKVGIERDSIQSGVKATQSCRMELLDRKFLPKWAQNKNIYFDVGHNPPAIKRVIQFLRQQNVDQNELTIVFGVSKGKNIHQTLSQLELYAKNIYLIEAKHTRAAKIGDLTQFIGFSKRPSIFRVINQGNIQKTLQHVTADSSNKNILICGSFFIMSEAKGFFQPELNKNSIENINQCFQLKND